MTKYLKVIFYSLLISNTSNFFCQKTIKIDYKLQIADEAELFNDNPTFRNIFLEIVNTKEKPTFSLIILDGNSYFFKKAGLTDIKSSGLMDGFSGYTGEIYNYGDSIYKKQSFLGNNVYQKSKNIENWIITDESKLIDNFLCFKATNIKKVIGNDKVFNHPVIAWFCPKIPYQLGPNGYGNLPGLILELQVRNVTFGMSKIDFESNEKFDINILKNFKMKSESEVIKIYENNHIKDGEVLKKSSK
jgi:GLPGLI family protein